MFKGINHIYLIINKFLINLGPSLMFESHSKGSFGMGESTSPSKFLGMRCLTIWMPWNITILIFGLFLGILKEFFIFPDYPYIYKPNIKFFFYKKIYSK